MKLTLLILCLVWQICHAQPNNEAKEKALSVINEITGHIKRYSLVKATFDWKGFENEISVIDASKYHPDSLMIPYILTLKKYFVKGGDNHSFYFGPKATSGFKAGSSNLKLSDINLLEEDVAIIKVPGIISFNKDDIKRYSDTMRSQIAAIDKSENIKGWIVDLRHNGGGTMWAMLAGLNPLLDDGTVGYFIDPDNKLTPWELSEKKQSGVGKLEVTYKCKDRTKKIAVLVDSLTGSSGEMTAIAFLGLPNVKIFGQPTYGATTANTTIPLSNGGLLLLATKYAADRNKILYKEKITPDVVTKYEETVSVAKSWIMGNTTK
jgi:carboxyl-terminal processing protease